LIVEHGGLSGLRDEGLLDSALARPRNLWVYGKPDEFALAARYFRSAEPAAARMPASGEVDVEGVTMLLPRSPRLTRSARSPTTFPRRTTGSACRGSGRSSISR